MKVIDAATGALKRKIGPFRDKVKVAVKDVNGDGTDDIVLTFKSQARKLEPRCAAV